MNRFLDYETIRQARLTHFYNIENCVGNGDCIFSYKQLAVLNEEIFDESITCIHGEAEDDIDPFDIKNCIDLEDANIEEFVYNAENETTTSNLDDISDISDIEIDADKDDFKEDEDIVYEETGCNIEQFAQELDDLLNEEVLDKSTGIPKSSVCWENEMIAIKAIYDDMIEFISDRIFKVSIKYTGDHGSIRERINNLKEELGNVEQQLRRTWMGYMIQSLQLRITALKSDIRQFEAQLSGKTKISFSFEIPDRYPYVPPRISFISCGCLNGKQYSRLLDLIRKKMVELSGQEMVFDLIEHIRDSFEKIIEDGVETIVQREEDELDYSQYAVTEYRQVNVYNPSQYAGNIRQLIKELPNNVRVTNIENVLRADLVHRFEGFQNYLRKKYIEGDRNKHRRLNKLDQIEVAYHGTYRQNVGNIVREGLVVPGNKGVTIAHGSRYGVGIYTSPDIKFAFHYSRGQGRLLVVATLPGKKYTCTESYVEQGCRKGFDSHQSADNTELVLFKAAQVLPCYVIHYEWKPEKEVISESAVDDLKESKKEQKRLLKLQAMKNLPYGFGPAGANFVVEEVGEIDEEDEDFELYQNSLLSEYQKDRGIW